jgi:hypothetical protein
LKPNTVPEREPGDAGAAIQEVLERKSNQALFLARRILTEFQEKVWCQGNHEDRQRYLDSTENFLVKFVEDPGGANSDGIIYLVLVMMERMIPNCYFTVDQNGNIDCEASSEDDQKAINNITEMIIGYLRITDNMGVGNDPLQFLTAFEGDSFKPKFRIIRGRN